MTDIALFDFDGTITTKEMFTPFMLYSLSKRRLLSGYFILLPDVVRYKLGLLHGSKVRQKMCHLAFHGKSETQFKVMGDRYAKTVIPNHVRAEAIERIAWHKSQGDRVVIVSASIDLYLRQWCEDMGIELICTNIATKDGKLTGKTAGLDCSAEEKSRRVLKEINLKDYHTVYAYGDTAEDVELLALADEQYYRYFE